MTNDVGNPFASLVALHQQLVRNPLPGAKGGELYPRSSEAPDRWTPTFELSPYRAVDPESLKLGGTESFHDLESVRLQDAIAQVVEVEGSVHFDILGDRLLEAAGVSRMGSKIRERIEAELAELEAAEEIVLRDSFVGRSEHFVRPPFRDWSELVDKHRKLDYVADTELMLCLFHAVLDDEGIDTGEAMNRGIYRIGFKRLTENARERLQAPLQALFDQQLLRKEGESLYLGLQAFVR